MVGAALVLAALLDGRLLVELPAKRRVLIALDVLAAAPDRRADVDPDEACRLADLLAARPMVSRIGEPALPNVDALGLGHGLARHDLDRPPEDRLYDGLADLGAQLDELGYDGADVVGLEHLQRLHRPVEQILVAELRGAPLLDE